MLLNNNSNYKSANITLLTQYKINKSKLLRIKSNRYHFTIMIQLFILLAYTFNLNLISTCVYSMWTAKRKYLWGKIKRISWNHNQQLMITHHMHNVYLAETKCEIVVSFFMRNTARVPSSRYSSFFLGIHPLDYPFRLRQTNLIP